MNEFEEIKEYKKLLDEGIITEQDFKKKKQSLLDIPYNEGENPKEKRNNEDENLREKRSYLKPIIIAVFILIIAGALIIINKPIAEKESTSQSKNSTNEEVFFESIVGSFVHTRGVGGWCQDLELFGDGHFTIEYHDSDMGDTGEGYPNGIIYRCIAEGSFDTVEKIDEFTYKMKLSSLDILSETDTTEIVDGTKYIYTGLYGISEGDTFYVYTKNSKIASLPDDYVDWIRWAWEYDDPDASELPFDGLYDETGKIGFIAYLM